MTIAQYFMILLPPYYFLFILIIAIIIIEMKTTILYFKKSTKFLTFKLFFNSLHSVIDKPNSNLIRIYLIITY